MTRTWCIALMLLTIAAFGYQALHASSGTVFIEGVSGHDSLAVYLAHQHLAQWARGMGLKETHSRETADFIVKLVVLEADAFRRFNWWFPLFFWMWPLVPATTVHASVELSVSVTAQSGEAVFARQVSAQSRAWAFADLFTRANRRERAMAEAFRLLAVGGALQAMHPGWSETQLSAVTEGQIAIGLTKQAVLALWGEPRMALSDQSGEWWSYGAVLMETSGGLRFYYVGRTALVRLSNGVVIDIVNPDIFTADLDGFIGWSKQGMQLFFGPPSSVRESSAGDTWMFEIGNRYAVLHFGTNDTVHSWARY